jgi:hypothetical protein
MPNPTGKDARFVHPSEFGMDFPINTPQELCNVANAINGGRRKRIGVITKDETGKPVYKKIGE